MAVFLAVSAATLGAFIGIAAAWKKYGKPFTEGEITNGLIFAATATTALLGLLQLLASNAVYVGWQAVGAAAFVSTTPLLLALVVLVELRSRQASKVQAAGSRGLVSLRRKRR